MMIAANVLLMLLDILFTKIGSEAKRVYYTTVVLGTLCLMCDSSRAQFTDYATAYRVREEKPLVALVTAAWCAPCQALKAEISRLDESITGPLSIASVDYDREPELARRIMASATKIPCLVAYRKQGGEWIRRERRVTENVREWLSEIKHRSAP